MRDKALEASLLIIFLFCTNFYLILWSGILEEEPLLQGVFFSLIAVGATYVEVNLLRYIARKFKIKSK